MIATSAELSRVINVDQVKGTNYELDIVASDAECLALAKRFDLIKLEKLTAHFIFISSPSKKDIQVKASFEGHVVQRCSVTLEPLAGDVKGEFWCDYSEEIVPENVEIIEFDTDTDDPAEPIVDGTFDVGIMLTEHFGLELDPFPRSPSADFGRIKKEAGDKLDDGESDNPFAVLKKLK